MTTPRMDSLPVGYELYHYPFSSLEKAEAALESDFNDGDILPGECPIIVRCGTGKRYKSAELRRQGVGKAIPFYGIAVKAS